MNNSSSSTVQLDRCGNPAITNLPMPYVWVEVIAYPILLVICIIGNAIVLNVVRMERRRVSTSIQVYLFTIAVADLILLVQHLPWYVVQIQENILSNVDDAFKQFMWVYGGISLWAEKALPGISDWALIVFSVERLAVTLWPMKTKRYICPRSAKIAICIGLITVIVTTVENLVEHYFKYVNIKAQEKGLIPIPKWLMEWGVLQNGFYVAVTITEFFFLLTINIILAVFLTRHHRRQQHQPFYISNCTSTEIQMPAHTLFCGRKDRRYYPNLLILSSFVLYFVTHLPYVLSTVLTLAAQPPFCSFRFPGDSQVILLSIANQLIFCNYSLTIVFYGVVSRNFRKPVFCVL